MGLATIQGIAAIREPVRFIAELFEPDQWPPTLAIAPNNYDRSNNIYAFSIASQIEDYENYWIAWGGTFDNPTNPGIQIYMDIFLTQVFLSSALEAINNSFWVDTENDIVYMHIDKNPWQYFKAYASLYGNVLSTFATAPKDESNPSDNKYGPVVTRQVMDIPTLSAEINDIISGVITYDTFSLVANNADGYYDGFDIINYFNTPLKISKTSTGADLIEDFEQIRYGIVNDIKVDFEQMEIEATDQFYTMSTSYCNTFSKDIYPNIESSDENDDIPVAWGAVKHVKPIKVDKDTADPATWIDYIAIDPDYITSVQGVYDEDGNSLTYSFNTTTGIIRVTSVDGDGEVIEAEYMNVTGLTDCNIGEIITYALAEKENIQYIAGIWDLTETDYYISIAPDVGFYFEGGTTRELIEAVLKNDNAFLIQKNDGLLTLRRWGVEYDTYQIPSWTFTGKPKKKFEDATKYYCSSVKVKYNRLEDDDDWSSSYLDESQEMFNFERYRKSYLAEFETCLKLEDDAIALAGRLLDRFGEVRETLELALGVDTFQINLLDTIEVEPCVNDREFSQYSKWIVKKIDPGQDTLEAEGTDKYYTLTFDDTPAELDTVRWYVSGIL